MPILAETFFCTYDKNGTRSGIAIEEYKGSYGIAACYETKTGELKSRWCYPEKDRKPVEKPVPMKMNLGDDKPAAAEWLQTVAGMLTDSIGGDDIAF